MSIDENILNDNFNTKSFIFELDILINKYKLRDKNSNFDLRDIYGNLIFELKVYQEPEQLK